MKNPNRVAEGLEKVSANSAMTNSALIMGMAGAAERRVTNQEIAEAPRIPENATRAEYAAILRTA